MAGEKILVIEDEPGVLRMTMEVLRSSREGYVVEGASDPTDGLSAIQRNKPDLVLLDLNLGRRFDGLDVCKQIRANPETADIAIVVLTGELMDSAESMLLDAGADDYIRKPHFTPQLLESRMRAVLRRTSSQTVETIEHGPLTVHPARREALIEGRPLALTPTEFDIVLKLAMNRERALARKELLDRGEKGATAIERTVDVHVLSIRRKLDRHEWLVETVFGVGYRLGSLPDQRSATRP